MVVDAKLLAIMPHLFGWKRKTGQDAWQNPTFEDAVEIRGIHHDIEHEVVDDNGVKRTATGTAYLADVYGITGADVLEFCGKPLGEIIKVESWPDPRTGLPYASVVHHG